MKQLEPTRAREFWRALAENAIELIWDAHVLLEVASFGRARSLLVLAQEELGKALWLYEHFEDAWSTGDVTPRDVPQLEKHGRNHVVKFMSALRFGDRLPGFWGDYSTLEDIGDSEDQWTERIKKRQAVIKHAAREANTAKQRGFYVDLNHASGAIGTPSEVGGHSITEDIQTVAQVIEMHLISDHTRMQRIATVPFDSTTILQERLLPLSHPVEWANFLDSSRSDD